MRNDQSIRTQTKDEDFKGIVAGLEDAIAFVRGDSTRGRVAAGPACHGEGRGQACPELVEAAIRAKTRLSQAES